jgi:hypothetical protein
MLFDGLAEKRFNWQRDPEYLSRLRQGGGRRKAGKTPHVPNDLGVPADTPFVRDYAPLGK